MFEMVKKIFVETFRSTTVTTSLKTNTRYSGKASLEFLGERDEDYYDMSYLEPNEEITPCYRSETNTKRKSNGDVETRTSITERWSLDLYSNGFGDFFVNLKDIINILSHCSTEHGFGLSVAKELNWKIKGDDDYDEDNEDLDGDGYYDGDEDEYRDGEDYDGDGEYDE